MPKMKTHSATKKRFHITPTGKVVYKKCGHAHKLSCKNAKRLRTLKQLGVLTTATKAHVKKVLPYA
ncbi:MAG: 50S ribosomal protein L35 [Synergistaceae bacterium]|nr:50S ribosomal protein L35 [Candidatus Equadaptatus faecalis]MDO4953420.1 50S ribosomal protein L35 [Synergistaceae bacterium]